MTWFAVQDSDWDWGSGEGPALIVEADSPEEAIQVALSTGFAEDADGGNVKVGVIVLVGFMDFELQDDKTFKIGKLVLVEKEGN